MVFHLIGYIYHLGNPRQELDEEIIEECFLLAQGSYSATFLIYSRLTCLGIALPSIHSPIPSISSNWWADLPLIDVKGTQMSSP